MTRVNGLRVNYVNRGGTIRSYHCRLRRKVINPFRPIAARCYKQVVHWRLCVTLLQATSSSYVQSATSLSVVTPTEVDAVDRRSSPASGTVDFESFCDERERAANHLGPTSVHNAVVPSSTSSTGSIDSSTSGSVYSLFSVSASDSADFASKSRTILVLPYQTLWQYSAGTPSPQWGRPMQW